MDGLMNHKSSVDSEEYPPVVVVSTKQSIESSLGSLQNKSSKSSFHDMRSSPRSQIAKSVLDGNNAYTHDNSHGFLGKAIKKVSQRPVVSGTMSRSVIEQAKK